MLSSSTLLALRGAETMRPRHDPAATTSGRVSNTPQSNPTVPVCGTMSGIDRVDLALIADEARRMSLPHVVNLFDRSNGLSNVFGPFDTGVDALRFADELIESLAEASPAGFEATVIPLEAPE